MEKLDLSLLSFLSAKAATAFSTS